MTLPNQIAKFRSTRQLLQWGPPRVVGLIIVQVILQHRDARPLSENGVLDSATSVGSPFRTREVESRATNRETPIEPACRIGFIVYNIFGKSCFSAVVRHPVLHFQIPPYVCFRSFALLIMPISIIPHVLVVQYM